MLVPMSRIDYASCEIRAVFFPISGTFGRIAEKGAVRIAGKAGEVGEAVNGEPVEETGVAIGKAGKRRLATAMDAAGCLRNVTVVTVAGLG